MPSISGFIFGIERLKLTVLIDLDDTLLKNDMDRFLKYYLGALSKRVNHLPAEKMIHALLFATQKMITKTNAELTLEACFDQYFYPDIGRSKELLTDTLNSFYRDDFPALQVFTEKIPGAHELIAHLKKNQHRVVLATNPLFPRTAILQRLEWAGLSPADFDLITDYHSFHFAKPNPAFYREILTILGRQNSTAVMIGNDLKDDMVPASAAGFPVFWISTSQEPFPTGFHPLSSRGNILDAIVWVDRVSRTADAYPPAVV
jgi:FMN phosphatase YigB (HAD superfamily)